MTMTYQYQGFWRIYQEEKEWRLRRFARDIDKVASLPLSILGADGKPGPGMVGGVPPSPARQASRIKSAVEPMRHADHVAEALRQRPISLMKTVRVPLGVYQLKDGEQKIVTSATGAKFLIIGDATLKHRRRARRSG